MNQLKTQNEKRNQQVEKLAKPVTVAKGPVVAKAGFKLPAGSEEDEDNGDDLDQEFEAIVKKQKEREQASLKAKLPPPT